MPPPLARAWRPECPSPPRAKVPAGAAAACFSTADEPATPCPPVTTLLPAPATLPCRCTHAPPPTCSRAAPGWLRPSWLSPSFTPQAQAAPAASAAAAAAALPGVRAAARLGPCTGRSTRPATAGTSRTRSWWAAQCRGGRAGARLRGGQGLGVGRAGREGEGPAHWQPAASRPSQPRARRPQPCNTAHAPGDPSPPATACTPAAGLHPVCGAAAAAAPAAQG